ALKARTGELTPPGISCSARSRKRRLSSSLRGMFLHGDEFINIAALAKAPCLRRTLGGVLFGVVEGRQDFAHWGHEPAKCHVANIGSELVTVTYYRCYPEKLKITGIRDGVAERYA